MKKLVSVIIPSYNVEQYITYTIESVLNQTYRNFEVIVVDDGSSDRTVDKIIELAKNDSRLKLIVQENKGVSYARNVGIDNSRGEMLAFLDSDDFYEPSFIEKMVKLMLEGKTDIAFCGFRKVTENGKIIFSKVPTSLNKEITDGKTFLFRVFSKRSYFCMNSAVFNRKLIETYGIRFVNGAKNGQDTEFIWKSIFHSERVICTKKILVDYLERPDSNVNNPELSKLHAIGCTLRTLKYLRYHDAEKELIELFENKVVPISFTSKIYFFAYKRMPRETIMKLIKNKNYRYWIKKAKLKYLGIREYIKSLLVLLAPELIIKLAKLREKIKNFCQKGI